MPYTNAQCAEIAPGTVASADGATCVVPQAEQTAWYADPQFWLMFRASESQGGSSDPLSMILSLIQAGASPGNIDPALTIPLCPEGYYQAAPAYPGGPPQCVPMPSTNGNGLPSWALPAGLAVVAVLLLRR